MKINSLIALKRAVQTYPTIRVIEHWQPQLVGTERKPCRIQGNGYWFMAPQAQDGKIVRMWAPYPKASELQFNENGTVTFHPGTERSWTLEFRTEA